MFFVYRYVGFAMDMRDTLKTAAAAAVMGLAALGSYELLFAKGVGNTLSTLTGVMVGGGIYAVALLLLGSIGERELLKLPVIGRQLASVLKKIHLLRR